MIRKTQLISLVLIYTILIGGCNMFNTDQSGRVEKEIKRTPTEEKKAKLLNKANRDFDDPDTHFELGRLYQTEGLWIKAEQEYKTTLNFDPVHKQAQAARIKVLANAGDPTKSELLANEYIERASHSALASLELGLAFQSQGYDDYAYTYYQQAIRLAPNSAKVNRQIGYYYLSKGDRERAKDYLSRSFRLNSNQPEVAHQLGLLGVVVSFPEKTKNTKKLEKAVDKYDKQLLD